VAHYITGWSNVIECARIAPRPVADGAARHPYRDDGESLRFCQRGYDVSESNKGRRARSDAPYPAGKLIQKIVYKLSRKNDFFK
jgi:hypothetical protein